LLWEKERDVSKKAALLASEASDIELMNQREKCSKKKIKERREAKVRE
jgi:hypothetical protein